MSTNAYANLDVVYKGQHIIVHRKITSRNSNPSYMFPGGHVDQVGGHHRPDTSMRFAALREFHEETGEKFKTFLSRHGKSFEAIEDDLSIVGMMDNREESRGNPGVHINYQLDLERIIPSLSQREFLQFVHSLTPMDDLAGGRLFIKKTNELSHELSNRKFRGGFRTAVQNIALHGNKQPTLVTYPGGSEAHLTNPKAQEQAFLKLLKLAPKKQVAMPMATPSTKTYTQPLLPGAGVAAVRGPLRHTQTSTNTQVDNALKGLFHQSHTAKTKSCCFFSSAFKGKKGIANKAQWNMSEIIRHAQGHTRGYTGARSLGVLRKMGVIEKDKTAVTALYQAIQGTQDIKEALMAEFKRRYQKALDKCFFKRAGVYKKSFSTIEELVSHAQGKTDGYKGKRTLTILRDMGVIRRDSKETTVLYNTLQKALTRESQQAVQPPTDSVKGSPTI